MKICTLSDVIQCNNVDSAAIVQCIVAWNYDCRACPFQTMKDSAKAEGGAGGVISVSVAKSILMSSQTLPSTAGLATTVTPGNVPAKPLSAPPPRFPVLQAPGTRSLGWRHLQVELLLYNEKSEPVFRTIFRGRAESQSAAERSGECGGCISTENSNRFVSLWWW